MQIHTKISYTKWEVENAYLPKLATKLQPQSDLFLRHLIDALHSNQQLFSHVGTFSR